MTNKMVPVSFRKRPVVIEAMLHDGSEAAASAIARWANANDEPMDDPTITFMVNAERPGEAFDMVIQTLEGGMSASVGDWIIRGVKGEHYACKPDIFAMTYEAAAPEPPSVEAGELPPLPSPAHPTHSIGPLWSAKQMLAYGAICASRPAPVGVVDDAMVERACEAYWIHWNLRGYYNAGSKAAKRKLMMPALQAAALTPAAPVAESVAEYVSGYCASCGSPCDIDGTSIAHPNKVSDPPPVAAGLTDAERAFVDELGVTLQGPGPVIGMTKAMAGSLYSAIRRLAASPVSGGTGNG